METVEKITRIIRIERIDVELQRMFKDIMKQKGNLEYIWTVKNDMRNVRSQ